MANLKRPFFEHGFWWWWNPERKDWFVGCAPSIGYPKWWKSEWGFSVWKAKVETGS